MTRTEEIHRIILADDNITFDNVVAEYAKRVAVLFAMWANNSKNCYPVGKRFFRVKSGELINSISELFDYWNERREEK